MLCTTNTVSVHCAVGETGELTEPCSKLDGGGSKVPEKPLRQKLYAGLGTREGVLEEVTYI